MMSSVSRFGSAAATAAACVALASTTPAAAASSCSILPPARVALGGPQTQVTPRVGADCTAAATDYAIWSLRLPSASTLDTLFFDITAGDMTSQTTVFDDDPLGTYSWRPEEAATRAGTAVDQNTATSVVRVASWASFTGSRSGSSVGLVASVARYSGSYDRYIPWTRKVGAIQTKASGSNTWVHLGYVQSNDAGKATFSGSIPSTSQVRVVFPNETYIWGVATPGRTF